MELDAHFCGPCHCGWGASVWRRGFAVLLIFGCAFAGSARAGETHTLSWPPLAPEALPEWLGEPSAADDALFPALHLPLAPLAEDPLAELAVTVFFLGDPGEFLRAFWVAAEHETLLSHDLQEGVNGPHQRTLLLPRSLLVGPGVLTFQASSEEIPIYAVRFEWLRPREMLLPPGEHVPALRLATGQEFAHRELAGVPYLPPPGGWRGDVVTTALSDRVEALEDGVVFPVALDRVPSQARLSLRLAGADLSQPVLVWVNGEYAGFLAVHTPDLADEGYYEDPAGGHHYAGWRAGDVFLPGHLFRVGENDLQLGFVAPPASIPSAKDVTLQLRYPGATEVAPPAGEGETLGPPPGFMLMEEERPQFRFE